ncbi:MAG: FeoB-associated Cys-rich membrane protein [Lachnospiraceae bacterium]|nr:FeoB-associated Cys-rich membrane protein [Lachnospiraceae bacterium]
MEWLADNWGTIVVAAVLLLVVFLLVRNQIKNRHKPACGGNCSGCNICSTCPSAKPGANKLELK